jgi:hypothetical protein
MHLEIILHEKRRVPAIGVTGYRGVLRDRARNSNQEIRESVTGRSRYTSDRLPAVEFALKVKTP